jgi:predicted SAM-dependent methyltransferase
MDKHLQTFLQITNHVMSQHPELTKIIRDLAEQRLKETEMERLSSQWLKLESKDLIKLELGSGAKKGINGFTTVDMHGADINWDLSNGIPLKDNSVSIIYSSHMLEHIPFSKLIIFLKECLRVLKNGGLMSVCVPNIRHYIQAYIEKRYFVDLKSYEVWQPGVPDTGSYLDQLNYMAYMAGEHCYMFDEENLLNTLRTAGFNSVSLRSFDESIDLRARHFESIYASATK